MAIRQTFGKTWWGEQWLNALSHIDYGNRLPRGRTYANNGSVRDLLIDEGTIKAKVRGSRPKPYQIVIKTPVISISDTTKLLDQIVKNPSLIARLLNRELDPVLLDKAKSLGFSLFPTHWQDLNMSCSCPDYAVPCKHLAAVIYLLSREIDTNPFLVFSLRGVDLIQALKDRNIHIEQEAQITLPRWADSWLEEKSALANTDQVTGEQILGCIDFSTIPALSTILLQLLPSQPSFFSSGDFREVMRATLARVSKSARKALAQINTGAILTKKKPPKRLTASDRPIVVFNHLKPASITGASQMSGMDELLSTLAELDVTELPHFQLEITALFQLKLVALHLLAQGAIVPALFAGDKTTVEVRWFPAVLDKTIQGMMQRMSDTFSLCLGRFERNKKTISLSSSVQITCLCSLFLDYFIHLWSRSPNEKNSLEKSFMLFFISGTADYSGSGEGSTALGIHAWLARLHLGNKDYLPVLCLDEAETDDFLLHVAVEKTSDALEKPIALQDVFTNNSFEKFRFGILKTISLLADFFPPLNDYLSLGASTPIHISSDDLPQLLSDTLPILRFLGIRILMPKALNQLLRPRLSVQIKGKVADALSYFKIDDLLSFDWQVAVGDQMLTRSEFDTLLKSASTLVRFKGQYVYLDANEIEQLRIQLAKPPTLSVTDILRVALAGEFLGATVGLDKMAQQIMRELTQFDEVALPQGLQATLRPYQLRGYAWLYRNTRIGFGSVIADDMGLGKTLQVITAILKLKEEQSLQDAKVLIIVPTTLLTNWQKELARFAPSLTVAIFHGAKRELAKDRPDVLLTTLGVIRTATALLKAHAWTLVVIDEAQNIKNPTSAQTKAAKSIPAKSFIAMSGTPVENRLSEYWSIMDFANRGYLGNLTQFVREYAKPIQIEHDQSIVERFKRVTAPFLLRRLKSDKSVISDLPDKIEQDQYCALHKTQAVLYQSVVEAALRTIEGESDTFKRQGLVLQMILALKQICNHPFQYLKQGREEVLASGKIERLFELTDDIHDRYEKVLIFTQFREMGNLLSGWLQQRYGDEPLFLHGGLSRTKRDEMVARFQQDRTVRIFILSLKAGGTGLNLTAASNVIHYDLWWNPAVEAQATDRAYRIGQQQHVQVHRLITRRTFEERINEMIQSKKALAELTVGTGEQWIGHLSSGELKSIFNLTD